MLFEISTRLCCSPTSEVDLPVESWEDLQGWFVMWDTLHYTLDGETWHEVKLHSDVTDIVEWARPIAVNIRDFETHEVLDERK